MSRKRYFEENEGHGRSEYRECVCISAKNLQYFLKGWTGIKTLAMINSIRKTGDKEATMETRYYISSLEPDPVLILKSVRSHWEVENNLHWVLDIGFREDDDRKTGNAAINFSAISKLALMLLKQSDIKLGMAGKRKACGWDEKIRDKVIGIGKNIENNRMYKLLSVRPEFPAFISAPPANDLVLLQIPC